MVTSTKEENQDKLLDFLTTATPAKLVEFIYLLESQQDHDLSEIVRLVKMSTFLKIKSALKFPSMTFKCTQKRYYTHLHINAEINDISLWISAKDAKNLDEMYVRLYDLHRDELLEMLEIRCPEPQPSNEFSFTPTFVNQYSEMEVV